MLAGLALAVLFGLLFFPRAAWYAAKRFSRQKEILARQTLVSASPAAPQKRFGLPVVHRPFTTYELTSVFGDLKFVDPVAIAPIPDRPGELAVAQRNGLIYAVRQQNGQYLRQVYLDLRRRVHSTPNLAEEGLLGFAFHPDFTAEGHARKQWLFVSYTGIVYDKPTLRITRFEAPQHSSTIDNRTETVLIDQVYHQPRHKGGCLAFGPDRFLYISFGDDGDAPKNAQHLDGGFFSGIVRIDVDQRGGEISHPIARPPVEGFSQNYFIPNNNPFVGQPDVLEEFFAIGFRNPWRFSFQPGTDKLLVGDVGDKLREEVTLVGAGDNGAWPLREGNVDKSASSAPVKFGSEAKPIIEYPRTGFHLAVIGGYIYRGDAFPALRGQYIYADQSGRVYAANLNASPPQAPTLLATLEDVGVGVSSLGEDAQGELYFCTIGELGSETGRIYHLHPNPASPVEQPPERLSETGLFADLTSLKPVEGFVAYDVVAPLWSDGAVKRRWISLPPDTKIKGKLRDRWKYPEGTIFIKHFEFPSANHPGGVRRIGTRYLLVDKEGRAKGATYRWNEEQTEAFRVDMPQEVEFEIMGHGGVTRKVTWSHPGRIDCQKCHNEAAGYVLGFNFKQLNRLVTDPDRGTQTGQLVRLRNLGLLENNFDDDAPGQLPQLAAIDDETATPEHRVRTYLDVNCAPCHRPGTHYADFDVRFITPLAMTNLLEGQAHHLREGDLLQHLVVPGSHDQSILLSRMQSSAPDWQMPPLGRNKIDDRAVTLITEWIKSLPTRSATTTAQSPSDAVK